MFPCSETIAKCFRAMKADGFLPSLFVTRNGVPPPGVHCAIHTPVNGPEMNTLASFVGVGGDSEAANMRVWEWEEKMPEVAREAPWFVCLNSMIFDYK